MHSVSVFNTMMEKHYDEETDNIESFAICGLLHDLCKAQFYKVSSRNVKNEKQVSGKKFRIMQLKISFPTVTVKSLFFSLNAKCTLKLMRLWQFVGIWVNSETKTATQSVRLMTSIHLP